MVVQNRQAFYDGFRNPGNRSGPATVPVGCEVGQGGFPGLEEWAGFFGRPLALVTVRRVGNQAPVRISDFDLQGVLPRCR